MKKTKIFNGNQYVGKFLCDGKKYTRFQVFKYKVRKFFRKLLIVSTVMAVLYGIYTLGGLMNPNTVYTKAEAETILVDNLKGKVEELKQGIVKDIQSCESLGHKEDDALIIFDTNNQASIGTYQFQIKTVIYYYKTLYGKDITRKEAVLIALDNEKAGNLAYDIVYKTAKGSSNWYTCSVKHNVSDRLKVINELSK